jgi:regulator of cell morphogenesis and NO signaling
MSIEDTEALNQLCARRPLAVRVMRKRGLDPGSRRTLGACCQEAGLDPSVVLGELGAAEDAVAGDWRRRPIPELLDHVMRTYHRPFAGELDAVAALLERARPDDEPGGVVWSELRRQLDELRSDLEQHMTKEEQVLFPWLRGRAETAAAPIRAMQLEHGDTIQLLLDVHASAARWQVSATGDAARGVAARLDELENWLCEHLHVENNELFRRALEAT